MGWVARAASAARDALLQLRGCASGECLAESAGAERGGEFCPVGGP
jgi:hypothetical protein